MHSTKTRAARRCASVCFSTPLMSLPLLARLRDFSVRCFEVRFWLQCRAAPGTEVHSFYNVMTMERNICESFKPLEFWLEKTKFRNCYKVRRIYVLSPGLRMYCSLPQITRTAIPSETLLILRAACAKITHLSNL
ncbi:hypothetical protein EDD18DRAFT_407799 [Armillaria luteobubalina]|uniref:Uncharacterized protein n=1 Tax=Armillaria luteobubalina TaxID=153913 RepID=A0AA39PZV1_9AGAR|nr:hypothetical protein EDD18DRAFT_407799 [Armillaria luteobubalina]